MLLDSLRPSRGRGVYSGQRVGFYIASMPTFLFFDVKAFGVNKIGFRSPFLSLLKVWSLLKSFILPVLVICYFLSILCFWDSLMSFLRRISNRLDYYYYIRATFFRGGGRCIYRKQWGKPEFISKVQKLFSSVIRGCGHDRITLTSAQRQICLWWWWWWWRWVAKERTRSKPKYVKRTFNRHKKVWKNCLRENIIEKFNFMMWT